MIDPLAEVVADMGTVAAAVGTRVLLVGAYARDLCFAPDRPPTRATKDADFAVLIEDWDRVDRFFDACSEHFRDINRHELLMYHRGTGLKVDLVPCGGIEAPPGTLALRGSTRRLTTTGLAECFDVGRAVDPTVPSVLVPPPEGFLILKLFAFHDRRERRDLEDFGFVLHALPVVDTLIWDDAPLMAAFGDGTLVYDDVRYWQAGRAIVAAFSATTVQCVSAVLGELTRAPAWLRTVIVDAVAGTEPDERLLRADRALAVLLRACSRD